LKICLRIIITLIKESKNKIIKLFYLKKNHYSTVDSRCLELGRLEYECKYYGFLHLGTKTFIRDNRNFDSSEFDSTGVKLFIFIYNEVRDFDKNSTQPDIRVFRVRDNESQLYYNDFF
jgi:hypothetical protein